MRHVLTNVVGARDDTDVEAGECPVRAGDAVLLCSDGLHGTLDDAAIQLILAGGGAVQEIVERLIGAALERGASDNVTALFARYAPE
jgi:protein phosphatase